jgi:iron-sulfur cluster repair protein YtfE (RIC family)
MIESKNLFSIAHDHFHGLMLAQMIKKDSLVSGLFPVSFEDKSNYTIHFYKMELENHFYIEENILQPLVRGISREVDLTFDIIIEQHKNIGEIISSLKDGTDLEERLDRAAKALEEHINFEENVLFPKIQDALSPEELAELAQRLKENGYENIYRY